MIDNKEPPDWAMVRAAELAGVGKIEVTANAFAQACSQMQVGFARYIAAHEEAPVDPLLIEAREICAQYWERGGNPIARDIARDYRNGIHDEDDERLTPVLAALKRGIELAKTGGAA